MRGTSLHSLSAVRDRFSPVLSAAGSESARLGEQLFMVLDALDSVPALGRALADPARSAEDKVVLVRDLLADGFDPRVVQLLEGVAAERWVADKDVADAVEQLAVEATLAAAGDRGQLAVVEDELFTIVRALIDSRDVRRVLSDPAVNLEGRVELLESILAGRGDEVSRLLAVRATRSPRGRRFTAILGWYGDIAAGMRDRLVALITTGSAFSESQTDRLRDLISGAYGRKVQMNINVDSSYLGGLRIQVGSEVVDATILSRLVDVQRRTAG